MIRKITRIAVCRNCKGDGFEKVVEHAGHSRDDIIHKLTCKYCLGSGLVRRIITIEDENHLPFKPN